MFQHKNAKSRFPINRRDYPTRWRTSNGIFETNKVANIDLVFPEYSNSKLVKVRPDVVEVPESETLPPYDLILGTETLAKLGVILNFKDNTISIDDTSLPWRKVASLQHPEHLLALYQDTFEPVATADETKRTMKILDAKYEKADLPKIVQDNCQHLTTDQRNELLRLLLKFEELFDGTLGDWDTEPVDIELKPDAKPYHGRAFPVPVIHKDTLMKELERLVELGVMIKQPNSEWGSPTFILPKKNKTVRVLTDFREVNKRIVRKPFPIPKIATVLQELEGFQYATALDLNMGYYTIRLTPDASKICTIVLPWGKYSYLRLPMGMSGSADIFQSKMTALMENLEYVRCYIDDLLILTKGSFQDHLEKLEVVFERLKDAKLRINANKSTFSTEEIEYLGYMLTRSGIKPQPNKVSAILALTPPENVKGLRRFLGIVQYYRDLWEKRSDMLAPLTDLVGECGETKVTKKNKTKKKPWRWDQVHQDAFDAIKRTIAREVILAYPDFTQRFDIYTDASKTQLGAVITQNNRPIAFFSRKLTPAQQKYSVTEFELLSIVETLKEFKGMLWGQNIRVYTDHMNLMRDALGLTSDRVYRWRLLLEEYGPEIVYIKGIANTVADAISRLEYNPEINPSKECFYTARSSIFGKRKDHRFKAVSKLLAHYDLASDESSGNTHYCHMTLNDVFANTGEDNQRVYPLTVAEIAEEQRTDRALKDYFNPGCTQAQSDFQVRVIDDSEVLVKNGHRLVIPSSLQQRAVAWYHHYLQHPGHTRLEETLKATMYWKSMRTSIRKHVKTCARCQKSKSRKQQYGLLPTKAAETIPWRTLCVDLIGPYTLKGLDGTSVDFMCLTMIDPATSWFELVELPVHTVLVNKKGKLVEEEQFDKSSARIAKLVNKSWLSRYPRSKYVIYDNGSEFKLHFESLCDDYGIKRKPTTIKNPQANAILERIHGVLGNMIRTANLDKSETVDPDMVDDVLTDAAWAVRSTHHTVLGTAPGSAIFGRDMLFNIPYIADWTKIGQRRQTLVNMDADRHNKKRIDYDYAVGDKVLLFNDGIHRKLEDKYSGPYVITQVHTNGTVRIQRDNISERINIRRLSPFFE